MIVILSLIALLPPVLGTCSMIHMPGKSFSGPLPQWTADEQTSAQHLRNHVTHLAQTIGERNVFVPQALQDAENYIAAQFESYGYTVQRQPFTANGLTVHNLIVEIPGTTRPDEIIVVGGHYDSAEHCPAANDNGSGVAATLELARLFKDTKPQRTLRFVAFVNEEPPFFHTEKMGSLVYARACRERAEKIVGMISLETMGYYDDTPGSQHYPFPFSLFYPDRGNFIAFVGNVKSRTWVRQCVRLFRQQAQFPSEGAAVPGHIQGVGWSDHWSFWQAGYPGLMVTDTAPFRYPYYHTPQDTADQVDYQRLARVVRGLAGVLTYLAESN